MAFENSEIDRAAILWIAMIVPKITMFSTVIAKVLVFDQSVIDRDRVNQCSDENDKQNRYELHANSSEPDMRQVTT
jgi:hypothetical protein